MRKRDRFCTEKIMLIHRGFSLSDMKCQQFLECGVFLLVNCLSACFVRIAALSVESRCHIKPARGTGNFNLKFWFVWQPAQIHIHVQMRLAGTSLCQRCLLSDEIPSAPSRLYNVLVADRLCHYSPKRKNVICFFKPIPT